MFYLIFCFIIVFFFSFWGGHRISENCSGIQYTLRFIIPLLCVCVILGGRYGWATDYLHYMLTYQFDDDGYYEPLFQKINSVLHIFKAPFPVAFFVYALICYGSALVLFKQFPKVTYLIFPCFVCLYFYDSSNLVRFSVGMAFIMLSIKYMMGEKTNLKFFIFFSICAILSHTGSIILVILLFITRKMHFLDNIRITIPLFLISCLLSADIFVKPLYQLIDILSSYSYFLGDLGVVRYLDNETIKENHFAEVRFETFYNRGKALYVYLLQIIYFFTIIYCGGIIKSKITNEKFNYVYRLSVLACILFIPFFGNELIMRVNSFLMALSSIILGFSIYYFPRINLTTYRLGVFAMGLSFVYNYIFLLLKNLSTNFEITFVWEL